MAGADAASTDGVRVTPLPSGFVKDGGRLPAVIFVPTSMEGYPSVAGTVTVTARPDVVAGYETPFFLAPLAGRVSRKKVTSGGFEKYVQVTTRRNKVNFFVGSDDPVISGLASDAVYRAMRKRKYASRLAYGEVPTSATFVKAFIAASDGVIRLRKSKKYVNDPHHYPKFPVRDVERFVDEVRARYLRRGAKTATTALSMFYDDLAFEARVVEEVHTGTFPWTSMRPMTTKAFETEYGATLKGHRHTRDYFSDRFGGTIYATDGSNDRDVSRRFFKAAAASPDYDYFFALLPAFGVSIRDTCDAYRDRYRRFKSADETRPIKEIYAVAKRACDTVGASRYVAGVVSHDVGLYPYIVVPPSTDTKKWGEALSKVVGWCHSSSHDVTVVVPVDTAGRRPEPMFGWDPWSYGEVVAEGSKDFPDFAADLQEFFGPPGKAPAAEVPKKKSTVREWPFSAPTSVDVPFSSDGADDVDTELYLHYAGLADRYAGIPGLVDTCLERMSRIVRRRTSP